MHLSLILTIWSGKWLIILSYIITIRPTFFPVRSTTVQMKEVRGTERVPQWGGEGGRAEINLEDQTRYIIGVRAPNASSILTSWRIKSLRKTQIKMSVLESREIENSGLGTNRRKMLFDFTWAKRRRHSLFCEGEPWKYLVQFK